MTMSGHGHQEDQSLPKSGDVIVGKYRIEKLIGKGGMGAVFSAQHELLGQRVAVKFLLGDIVTNQEAVQRFLNEARNAAKIQSEHVCRVMDVGTAESGLPYMVLEFLEGLDLSQRLEQYGPLGVEEAVDYTLQALEAIAQAHALGIVHRDLKPANLYLARRADGSTTVKVLDFGIAKASNPFGEGGNHSLTSTKSMLGSPLYMSPEQLRSAKNVDARADVWALGVILYELLTGTVPFNGETLGELFIAILEQPPMALQHKRGDIPQALNDAVARCLTRAPDQRYQNVAELAQGIASCAPARAYASIERITQTLGMPRASVVMPQPPAGGYNPQAQTGSGGYRLPQPSHVDTGGMRGTPPPQQGQTNASWGNTAGGVAPSKAPLFAGLAAGALVLVALAGFGVYAVTHRTPAATGGPSSSATTTATTAPTTTTTATTAATTATTTATTVTTATATADTSKPIVGTASTGNHPPTGTGTGTKPVPSGKASVAATTTTPPTATTKPTSTAVDVFGGR